jgi:diguanylate cyclase (GGDEF)-like protein
MDRETHYRLTIPGNIPTRRVLVAGVLAMVAIFVIDLLAGVDIRLHVLYVFPLAGIALHCKRIGASLFGLALSVALQMFTFFENGIRNGPLVTDVLVTFSASLLIIVLARATRENYLRMRILAVSDPLTGLHNRRSFHAIVELEISRQKRYGGTFSLAMVDLDNFKMLNDRQGHQAGDNALKFVAEVLREHIRETDSAARLGGDEFAILMPNTLGDDCCVMCRHMGNRISERMSTAGYAVTASIGCATFSEAPESMALAFEKADQAMYAAKAAGKGRIVRLNSR